ncbi:MAG: YXWGXW repeat-containing protein [Acidobacteriaceae bacterium]|nr:YXWGXW repeat-containing protein [Acidobacteriaceae bacterium]MBV9781315.1 YXWGXW repeat-containing protein [Acidobacteriaceae bacterium]
MQIKTVTRSFFVAVLLAILLCAMPTPSRAQVAVSITIAPPILPVYVQPPCPVAGWLWTPGYWAWGPDGYYWVPGVWVEPPEVGLLWTPGYWGFVGGIYAWHAGYWGPHIGFYGGVNYGFGYTGFGFGGGYWSGGVFMYNRAVMNVNTTVIRNVYVDRTVINNRVTTTRASFNGPGGVVAQPTAREQAAANERHIQPSAVQVSHQERASQDRALLASVNHGRPSVAAVASVNDRRIGGAGRVAERTPAAEGRARENANAGRREGNVRSEARPVRPATERPAPREAERVNREPARPSPAERPAPRPSERVNREPARPNAVERPAPRESERVNREPARPVPQERPQVSHEAARPAPQERPQANHQAARPAAERPAPREARPAAPERNEKAPPR